MEQEKWQTVTFNGMIYKETYVKISGGQVICLVLAKPKNDIARLIAAAPETAQQKDDLLEACQGSVIVINELLAILDNFVKAKQLSPFPHPPLKGIKATITNAGGEVYETAIQAKQAIAQTT